MGVKETEELIRNPVDPVGRSKDTTQEKMWYIVPTHEMGEPPDKVSGRQATDIVREKYSGRESRARNHERAMGPLRENLGLPPPQKNARGLYR